MYFINGLSRFTAPGRHFSLAPKGSSKFEMVKMKLVKMLSLKQEIHKISPFPMEKKHILYLQENNLTFLRTITFSFM